MIFRKKKQEKGFSLIELSIAMTIVGLIVAGMLQSYKLYKHNKIDADNTAKEAAIGFAIGKFVAQYGRYPCPADPTAIEGDADFGTESCTFTGTCSNGVCRYQSADDARDADTNPDWVMVGSLPFAALNLPKRDMLDAWGRRYTYVVTSELTDGNTGTAVREPVTDMKNRHAIRMRFHYEDMVTGRIQDAFEMYDADPDPDVTVMRQAVEDMLVISHGEDGKGAYTVGGKLYRPCATGASDTENCDADGIFTDPGNLTIYNRGDPWFNDDIVKRDIWEETNFWTYGSGGDIYNRYVNRVGVGVNAPSEDFDVVGNVRVTRALAAEYCDVNGDNCFDPDRIGGNGMMCGGYVIGFRGGGEGGEPVCAPVEVTFANTCPTGYLARGIGPDTTGDGMEVICGLP